MVVMKGCAIKPRLRLKRFSLTGIELGNEETSNKTMQNNAFSAHLIEPFTSSKLLAKAWRIVTDNCTACQCSPLRRKFMECSINNPALSLLMKHLVIGQRQKPHNFSVFHWSPFHWSKFRNHEGSTFTEKDRNKLNYRIGPKRT